MIAKLEHLVNLGEAIVQPVELPILTTNRYTLDVLRLDRIHPLISGNKWFKLKYSLEEALSHNKKSIVTIGGAYSNHILATACACKNLGLHCVGVIRGERSSTLSCTLQSASAQGMELEFVPRSLFADKKKLYPHIRSEHQQSFLIEEGGMNENGTRAPEKILDLVTLEKYQYICCAFGTGTMMAGIIRSSTPPQRVIGVSSLRISDSKNNLKSFLLEKTIAKQNYELFYNFDFGGYARHTQELLQFMNEFFIQTTIPTDFVYTGKLFYGVIELIKKSYFNPGSAILVIHSGGLQGNCSLPAGTLLF